MANNSTTIINSIISKTDKKLVELEARKEINVSMRIDEVIPFIRQINSLAKDDQSTRKFDLTLDKTGSCTVAYSVDGESVSAGSNVLKYGDELTITVTPATAYSITKLQVNGKDYVSGTKIVVDTDISIVVISTKVLFDLTTTADDHCSISVLKGATVVTAGTNAIQVGDVLTISATATEGYEIATLKVNGENFVSGSTITVSGDVTIVATSSAVVEPEA